MSNIVYIYRYTKVDVDLRSIFLNLTLLRTKLKFDFAMSCLNFIVCYVFFMQIMGPKFKELL